MKIFASALLCIGILFTAISIQDVAAQNAQIDRERARRSPSSDLYQEYIYNLNLFYNDKKMFESDRTKYQAYKTVQSRETALNSSIYMLKSSRQALLAYVNLIEKRLNDQSDLNTRVKEAIATDLQTHRSFLTETEQTVKSISSLEQSTQVSNALHLRYAYIKVTANQALLYIDVNTTKSRNDKMKEIVNDISSLIAGYPESSESKQIVAKWTQEVIPELTDNDNKLNEILETVYPVDANVKRPIFESNAEYDTRKLALVNTRLLQYAQKLKEINQLARQAYTEL